MPRMEHLTENIFERRKFSLFGFKRVTLYNKQWNRSVEALFRDDGKFDFGFSVSNAIPLGSIMLSEGRMS